MNSEELLNEPIVYSIDKIDKKCRIVNVEDVNKANIRMHKDMQNEKEQQTKGDE